MNEAKATLTQKRLELESMTADRHKDMFRFLDDVDVIKSTVANFETKLKMDLFSALGDAKRELSIVSG